MELQTPNISPFVCWSAHSKSMRSEFKEGTLPFNSLSLSLSKKFILGEIPMCNAYEAFSSSDFGVWMNLIWSKHFFWFRNRKQHYWISRKINYAHYLNEDMEAKYTNTEVINIIYTHLSFIITQIFSYHSSYNVEIRQRSVHYSS